MLNNWFYSHSTWAVAFAVCFAVTVIPVIGLFIFHRLVPWEAREKDNVLCGMTYVLTGGVFAVVLAFVAIGTYESMDKSSTIASNEANSLGGLAFDSAGLPPELGARVRADVNAYIDIVTKKEWPSQQAYHMEESNYEEGWAQVRLISLDLASFEPTTMGQTTVKADMMDLTDDLFSARRARLLAANAHLPNAVWQMLIFGLIMVSIYIYLFGPYNFKMHITCTALTMISIGLVFALTISLDYPFRGQLSVDDDAYLGIKEVAARAFEPTAPVTAGEGHVVAEPKTR
jgi:amino acid transporter